MSTGPQPIGKGPQPIGGGASFELGPEQNVFTGSTRVDAETARDDYDTANPAWIDAYNLNTSLNIRLEYYLDGNAIAVYQVRNSAGTDWADNSSSTGIKGQNGDAATVANLSANAIPVKSSTVEELIDSPAVVKDDGEIFAKTIELYQETAKLGVVVGIGDNVSTLGVTDMVKNKSYTVSTTEITDEGYERSQRIRSKEVETFVVNNVVDGSSPLLSTEHTVKYIALQNSFVKNVYLEFSGEVSNLQISIQEFIDGEFKNIYPFVSDTEYDQSNGIYIVDSLPPVVDPLKTYYVRDGVTGGVNIPIDNASFSQTFDPLILGPEFALFFRTTDGSGLKLKGSVQSLPVVGSQYVPILTIEQYDYDYLPQSDLRDVYRRYRDVDSNTTLSSLNDFDRDFNSRLVFSTDASLNYSTEFPWKEGASIIAEGKGGSGELSISGFNIDGLGSISIPDGVAYELTLEDGDVPEFTSRQITKRPTYLIQSVQFDDLTEQNATVVDTPQNVLFGPGGSSSDGVVTMGSDGVAVVNKSGPYAAKIRVNASRDGFFNEAELFFQVEMSTDDGATYLPLGPSVYMRLDDSRVARDFFGLVPISVDAGVKLRVRWARSSTGANSGKLITETPPAALIAEGFQQVPSATLVVYRYNEYPYI